MCREAARGAYTHAIRKIPIYVAPHGTKLEFDLKDYPVIFFKGSRRAARDDRGVGVPSPGSEDREPDLSGFDALSPDDIAYLDEHCHETGAPGQDRRAWLREHPDEQDTERE